MARIQWHGQTFNAEPVEQQANGDWLMRAQEHGTRFSLGTVIRVKASEIVEMAASEMPPTPTESQAALDKAMAAERETLPTVHELLATRDNPVLVTAPVPANITGTTDMASKLSQLAALANDTHKQIESDADAALQRLTAAKAKAKDGLAKLDGMTADVEQGASDLEDFANQLTNGGPALGKS